MSWVTFRTSVANAVADTGSPRTYQTYSYPPNAPIANSVIISWDSPAVEITNNQTSLNCLANLVLTCMVPALDNQSAYQSLENMIQSVVTKLKTNLPAVTIGNVSAPQLLTLASGDLVSADVTCQLLTTWS